MKTLAAFVVLLLLSATAQSQSAPKPEILVLGTFHMGNPGRDIHNAQVDDVLAPKRQREIAEVVAVLKRFRPTKIAVEVHVTSRRAAQQYADYLAGKYSLSRNEIDQLGYRLARELGHRTVYAVDENGDFPYYRVRNYAIANNLKDKFDALQARVGERVKAQQAYLRNHSILETLALVNADSMVQLAVGEYYAGYMPFGEPYEYAGPDLIASWFQRNVRIYRNILSLIESPNERILVIYGAGHLGWLQQMAASDPTVRLRKLADVLNGGQ
jgi:hypothetical protein